MNGSNVLLAIDTDLNALYHYNVPGSKWYQHKTGKWQSHAQYAMGKANPDAKEKKGTLSKLADKARSAKGRFDAKQDAAITAMRKHGTDTYGAERIRKQASAAYLAGSIAGSTIVGMAGREAGSAIKNALNKPSAVNKFGVSNYGGKMPSNVAMNKFGASHYNGYQGHLKTINNAVNNKNGALFRNANRINKAVDTVVKPGKLLYKGGKDAGIIGLGTALGKGAMYLAPSFVGSGIGGTAALKVYDHYLESAYSKRGGGSLKNMKVSKAYADSYRSTYDKYLKQYSKKVPT